MKVQSIEDIKKINLLKILNVIREFGSLSRSQISKHTGLSRSTCSLLIDTLLNESIVVEKGKDSSTGGRRGILVELNYNAGQTIGIKIFENCLLAAIVDMKGVILKKIKIDIQSQEIAYSQYIRVIKDAINSLLEEKKKECSDQEIIGIGIAVSGRIDYKKGILIESSILKWKNVNISAEINEEFGLPVVLENDVNSFAFGEKFFGIGKTENNFICISIGKGIGLGIILNGKLYRGFYDKAGELGHIKIVPDIYANEFDIDLPTCSCGKKGCLESFCSDHALIEWVRDQGVNIENISELWEKTIAGDSICRKAYDRLGYYLGTALSIVLNIIDPKFVIIGGESNIMGTYFIPKMKQVIENNSIYESTEKIDFHTIEENSEIWIKGVATLVIQSILENKIKSL